MLASGSPARAASTARLVELDPAVEDVEALAPDHHGGRICDGRARGFVLLETAPERRRVVVEDEDPERGDEPGPGVRERVRP
jgi:hypothetical protein